MRRKRLMAGIVTAAALVGGAGGAVAATSDKEAEQQVVSDAAKRLGVSSSELRSALAAAEEAQLDAAVKAGELTQEQADRIKEHRRADGTVLRLGPGGHHGGPGGHRGGGPQLMEDAARALGITEERLFDRLRAGESLGEIAEAEGKSLAEVKSAVKAAATKRLDADLQAGRITRAQHAAMVEHLAEHVDRLGERPVFPRHHSDHAAPGAAGSSKEGAVYRAA